METYLNRRDMSALYLTHEFVDAENERLRSLRPQTSNTYYTWALVNLPTSGYLWSNDNPDKIVTGVINPFFAEHGQFETEFKHANQIARVVKKLRDIGIFMPLDDPRMHEKYVLIPTIPGTRFRNELLETCGLDPLDWPDYIAYHSRRRRADWSTAHYPDKTFRRQAIERDVQEHRGVSVDSVRDPQAGS